MRVLTIIGNRPQFVKAAAVSRRLRESATEVLVHTGQHYDDDLSAIFFDELEIPRPEHRLDLGGGSNTEQTARMLAALGPLVAS
ncbi:MAG: UDP-GlcNAc3NAcA epimerase, partial [Solirubrobacteraceae bacterium]|nr:UDP-GlcNAc3NAcA epimerase [Solirubrobacteraceae bacterium]